MENFDYITEQTLDLLKYLQENPSTSASSLLTLSRVVHIDSNNVNAYIVCTESFLAMSPSKLFLKSINNKQIQDKLLLSEYSELIMELTMNQH